MFKNRPVKNIEVVRAWSRGESARNHKGCLVATEDGELYSYTVKIGQRVGGAAVLGDLTARGGRFYSQTTSCHVGIARRYADLVMHAKVWEVSPMSKDDVPF
jgi:hypothetical protein|tara:strand:- start:397 stop:702 length:306 start_codon:yes stop_codon:yes gene_type:complete